jgi:hypothetical protein
VPPIAATAAHTPAVAAKSTNRHGSYSILLLLLLL